MTLPSSAAKIKSLIAKRGGKAIDPGERVYIGYVGKRESQSNPGKTTKVWKTRFPDSPPVNQRDLFAVSTHDIIQATGAPIEGEDAEEDDLPI